VLHHLQTLVWKVWLTRNEDLHGHDSNEREGKRLKKMRPRITALCAKQDLLLTSDKQIFELPIHARMPLHSNALETWVRLDTPTVKRALTDAEQHLCDTNQTTLDSLPLHNPAL
jgi:hypothetical protein